jgi:hypothetical protein
MKTISKALVGTVAAGAMAMASATPAAAQYRDRDNRDRGGISAGEIIAGALIIGGIAAVASSANRGRGSVYEGGRYGDRYGYGYRGGNPRQAVEQCVYAAQQRASRVSYGGSARVTDIRSVNDKRDGFDVKGRIAVNTRNTNWRRGWGNDYRGWDNRSSGYDAGNFTCKVRYGRVTDLRFSGIRGLR